MSISSSTHNHFMQYVCLAQSLFDVTRLDGGRHAIVAVGQPTELFEWGFVVVNGDCDSFLQGAGQLTDWLSDPEWVLANTPGFIGPPLFLAHVERLDAMTISVTSCLLDTLARHTLHRTPLGVSLETLPLLDPWPQHVPLFEAVSVVLRLLQTTTSSTFDTILTDIIDRLDNL